MENKIKIFEIKEKNIFKNLLEVIKLLNSSKSLSKELECEATCQSLKLKFIQVGGDIFSSFEIFGMKSQKYSALYSNIEKIINIIKQENNINQKKFIEDCLKKILKVINEIITICEQNQSKNNQFINSIFGSSKSCENEIKKNENEIETLQSEIQILKNPKTSKKIMNLFHDTSSKNDELDIKFKSKEIIEKNHSIENIRIIIKNFGSIENEIKYNIDLFESIKTSWISINKKFENISNNSNNSNEWIFEKINEIIPNINKLKEQLNSISIELKSLENQFNSSLFSKDANIIN